MKKNKKIIIFKQLNKIKIIKNKYVNENKINHLCMVNKLIIFTNFIDRHRT